VGGGQRVRDLVIEELPTMTTNAGRWRRGTSLAAVTTVLAGLTLAQPALARPTTGFEPLEDCFGNPLNTYSTLYVPQGTTTIFSGTDGDDVIIGTDGSESIDTGMGDDVVCAGDGDDTITGGPSSDAVGTNHIDGEGGVDHIYGGWGDDVLLGGGNVDYVFGYGGEDLVEGNSGNDILGGEDGNDDLHGQKGDDHLDCGTPESPGWDKANGGGGDDTFVNCPVIIAS
jgi:Ca2+-binding RTX toxin-like protein